MKLLVTHVVRAGWRIRYRLAAVALVVAAGFGIYAGVYSAIDLLFDRRNQEFEEGHVADLEVRFAPEDSQRIPDLGSLPGIAESESRLVFPGQMMLADQPPLLTLMVTIDPVHGGHINRLKILEGEGISRDKPDHVVIDRNMAAFHHLKPGDSIELVMADESYHLKVCGIGLSPEFLLAPANPRVFIPSKGSLGVVYGLPQLIQERVGLPMVNSLLIRLKPGESVEKWTDEILSKLEGQLLLDQVIPSTEQFGSRFLELSLNAFRVCLPALVIVFDLTAFLVTFFLLFQWIVQERREIGNLMAFGYDRGVIGLAYLIPVAILGIIGSVVGLAVALAASCLFSTNYADSIGFPHPELALIPHHILVGVGGVGVILLAAVSWPLIWLLRLTPLEAVRESMGQGTDRLGILKQILAWLPGRIWLRYAMRNLARRKSISAMTILSVAAGLGVTISFFINLTSNAGTAVNMIRNDPWSAILELFAPVPIEDAHEFEAVDGVEKAVPLTKLSARLAGPLSKENIAIGGIPPESGIRQPEILAGRGLQAGDQDALVLERNLAEKCGVQIGQKVTIDSFGKKKEATVVGFLSGALPGEAYVPLSWAQDIQESGDLCSGFFLIFKGDPEQTRKSLFEKGNIAQITLKTEIVAKILETTGEKIGIIRLGAIFSVVITLLFIFCSVSFTILQRKQEYVMLRVLGMSDGSIVSTIIAEVLFLGLIAVLLAIPVGYQTAHFLNSRVSEAWFNVTLVAEIGDFLKTLIPGLLLMPIAALGAIRQILREPLDRSLRERQCG